MRKLNEEQLEEISGGFLPAVLGGALFAIGYVGALGTAQSFGKGLGMGLYDAMHNDD